MKFSNRHHFQSLLQDEETPEQALKRNPHHYRPIPLPLRDAIRYVKLYGKHTNTLKDFDRQALTTSRYDDIENHLLKRSELQCKNNTREKSNTLTSLFDLTFLTTNGSIPVSTQRCFDVHTTSF